MSCKEGWELARGRGTFQPETLQQQRGQPLRSAADREGGKGAERCRQSKIRRGRARLRDAQGPSTAPLPGAGSVSVPGAQAGLEVGPAPTAQ